MSPPVAPAVATTDGAFYGPSSEGSFLKPLTGASRPDHSEQKGSFTALIGAVSCRVSAPLAPYRRFLKPRP